MNNTAPEMISHPQTLFAKEFASVAWANLIPIMPTFAFKLTKTASTIKLAGCAKASLVVLIDRRVETED